MRFGVIILPDRRWAEAQHEWIAAEELGFDSAWTYDHCSWRSLADGPWFASIPTLTAVACATERIRLGTLVASPNFRHPVPFAKELMTLDDISGGRFVLGVGAGGQGFDADLLGQDMRKGRFSRFREFVGLLDQLLTHPVTDFHGEHYEAVGARMIPGCITSPRLPFVIAANGPKAIEVAATYGQGWVTTGPESAADIDQWWDAVAQSCRLLDETLDRLGKDRSSIDRYLTPDTSGQFALSGPAHFTAERAAQLGFDEILVHWPRRDGIHAGDPALAEDIAINLIPTLR